MCEITLSWSAFIKTNLHWKLFLVFLPPLPSVSTVYCLTWAKVAVAIQFSELAIFWRCSEEIQAKKNPSAYPGNVHAISLEGQLTRWVFACLSMEPHAVFIHGKVLSCQLISPRHSVLSCSAHLYMQWKRSREFSCQFQVNKSKSSLYAGNVKAD